MELRPDIDHRLSDRLRDIAGNLDDTKPFNITGEEITRILRVAADVLETYVLEYRDLVEEANR